MATLKRVLANYEHLETPALYKHKHKDGLNVGGIPHSGRLFGTPSGTIGLVDTMHKGVGGLHQEMIHPDGTRGVQSLYSLGGVEGAPSAGLLVVNTSASGVMQVHAPVGTPAGAIDAVLEHNGHSRNMVDVKQAFADMHATYKPTAGIIPYELPSGYIPGMQPVNMEPPVSARQLEASEEFSAWKTPTGTLQAQMVAKDPTQGLPQMEITVEQAMGTLYQNYTGETLTSPSSAPAATAGILKTTFDVNKLREALPTRGMPRLLQSQQPTQGGFGMIAPSGNF